MSNPVQAKFILALLGLFSIQLQNMVKIHSYGGFLNMKYNKMFALLITLTHIKKETKEELIGVVGFSSLKILFWNALSAS